MVSLPPLANFPEDPKATPTLYEPLVLLIIILLKLKVPDTVCKTSADEPIPTKFKVEPDPFAQVPPEFTKVVALAVLLIVSVLLEPSLAVNIPLFIVKLETVAS